MRFKSIKTKLFLLLLFFTISNGFACSCAEKATVKVNWEAANEVFIGKVIKIDTSLFGNNGAKIYSYTVKILKTFKKDFFKNREFRTVLSQDEASCDFMFQVGKEYLIYAKSESETLACSLCSRTNLIENVEKEEIQELEKLYKEYASNTDLIITMKMENNASYQVGLVKSAYDEKIKRQNLKTYILFAITILLILVILLFKKRKN